MNRDPIAASGPLLLVTAGLVSKWGFDDGGMPDEVWDVIDELREPGLTFERIEWHKVLIRLVREYLLPVLDQRVELVEIETSHNPIRASTVDGVDVEECWYGRQSEPMLMPDIVEVPMVDVIRICREVAGSGG